MIVLCIKPCGLKAYIHSSLVFITCAQLVNLCSWIVRCLSYFTIFLVSIAQWLVWIRWLWDRYLVTCCTCMRLAVHYNRFKSCTAVIIPVGISEVWLTSNTVVFWLYASLVDSTTRNHRFHINSICWKTNLRNFTWYCWKCYRLSWACVQLT